jgi:hypothetical protein
MEIPDIDSMIRKVYKKALGGAMEKFQPKAG